MKSKLHLFVIVSAIILFSIAAVLCFMSCAARADAQPNLPDPKKETKPLVASGQNIPKVYFTKSISPSGLMTVYDALGLKANGKVAVKLHTGAPGNPHFLNPNLIKEFVQKVNGTIVECNAVPGSKRASTAVHYQVAKDHGFTAIAPVVILDEKGEISLPVINGKHLKENIIGSRFKDFDFHIVLSHFKGHASGGFGGALKNMSIGYASPAGKSWIHSAGKTKDTAWKSPDQNAFLESMAEAAKTISDASKGRILYINVMNNLSVDCDCVGSPAKPTMADIGILASLDPVALDQACVDLIYAAADGKNVVERIESRNGLLTLAHAEKIGLGSKKYELIKF